MLGLEVGAPWAGPATMASGTVPGMGGRAGQSPDPATTPCPTDEGDGWEALLGSFERAIAEHDLDRLAAIDRDVVEGPVPPRLARRARSVLAHLQQLTAEIETLRDGIAPGLDRGSRRARHPRSPRSQQLDCDA
ncbi:MAG: hypothetical protein R2698_03015 [Microthrixaceae bacterium]